MLRIDEGEYLIQPMGLHIAKIGLGEAVDIYKQVGRGYKSSNPWIWTLPVDGIVARFTITSKATEIVQK